MSFASSAPLLRQTFLALGSYVQAAGLHVITVFEERQTRREEGQTRCLDYFSSASLCLVVGPCC